MDSSEEFLEGNGKDWLVFVPYSRLCWSWWSFSIFARGSGFLTACLTKKMALKKAVRVGFADEPCWRKNCQSNGHSVKFMGSFWSSFLNNPTKAVNNFKKIYQFLISECIVLINCYSSEHLVRIQKFSVLMKLCWNHVDFTSWRNQYLQCSKDTLSHLAVWLVLKVFIVGFLSMWSTTCLCHLVHLFHPWRLISQIDF